MTTAITTLEETLRLLQSSDEELLGSLPDSTSYASVAFVMTEVYALTHSPDAGVWSTPLTLWRIYKDVRTRAQRASGSLLAQALAYLGGGGICERLDYCHNQSQLKELFDFAKSPEATALLSQGANEVMASDYAPHIEKLHELLGKASEAISEALVELFELTADIIVPAAFTFMIVKYGLDELCACCAACDGFGQIDLQDCEKCDGRGHFRKA